MPYWRHGQATHPMLTEGTTLTWTRITDPDEAADFLPAWFGSRMIGLRGKFGLVLTTGDILMISSIGALHQSSDGAILLAFLTGSTRRGRRSTISVRRFRVRR